jgi:DNA-binding transcriptional LysR family regulator
MMLAAFMPRAFLHSNRRDRASVVRNCAKGSAFIASIAMDWDNVRVFLAVARAGQFVAGARKLHLDHATASRRVAALEAALGAKLFDRRTTGARLTSAGERFLVAAEQMESAFLHAAAEVSDVDVELIGEVRIGAPDGFSTYYLAAALRGFVEKNPGVRIQLAPLPQLTPLARREIDIVVGLDKPEQGRFVSRKLTDYTLGVYASAEYLANCKPPADVGELGLHRLIGYVEEHAFSTALDYVRELYGGAPTHFECASAVTQLEALRAGVGLGVVHDFIARRFSDLVRVLPERRATRAYWIVTHQDTRGLGRIRAVHDHLVACVEGDRGMFMGKTLVNYS